MSAALRGTPSAGRNAPLFWEYGRNEEWFKYPAQGRSPNVAMREGHWKLLVNADGSKAELYDVIKDRGEERNLAADEPEVTAQLRAKALAWRKSLPGPAAGVEENASVPARRPNIVVFLTDDQDQLDSSIYGERKVHTPNMARLAAAGMTFTHAFAASPSCAPSRAALLTGLMPARNGAEENHSRPRAEIRKLPHYLKQLGYEVVSFGKVAHYGHGKEYGFDHVEFEAFHDHRGIDAAVTFLEKRDPKSSKPLCIFVGTHWPHRPWPKSAGLYDPDEVDIQPHHVDTTVTRSFRARYYNAVSKADDYLGRIYDAATMQLGTNTLFLMSSDHGAQWPLGKWNLYDSGIRVPFMAAWPGVIKPGARTAALISWVDILPTLIEVGGGKAPAAGLAEGEIDGRSFLPVLRGGSDEHRDRIFATHSGDKKMNVYPIRAVRTDRWKYIWNLHPEFQHTTHVDRAQVEDEVGYWRSWERAANAGDAHADAVIQRYRQRPTEELYDLNADPFEQRNLAGDPTQAGRRDALRAELEGWMREQGDQKKVYNQPVLLESNARP
jgi:N-sulfoglucosamine sulfohydrolase